MRRILHIKFFCVVALMLSAIFISYAGAQDKIELKNAKELSGKIIDGQSVREAKGDVEFVQGNVKVFCNNAVQYIATNRIELTGNVRMYQDTLTLFTERAVYTGDDRRAVCSGGVTLKDPNATLRSDDGVYTFNDARAIFKGDVIITNPGYTITSDELIYFRNTEESYATGRVVVTTDSSVVKAEKIDFMKREGRTFARGNVEIESDSTIIYADTATNYSDERRSVAYGNVRINSLNNNTLLFAERLENFERDKFTRLTDNTILIQSEAGEDTLFIYCDSMLAMRNEPETYIASGNTEIIRGGFFSKCGSAEYFKAAETVSLTGSPIVWQDRLQLTGDSIYAELPGKKLQTIFARKLAGKPGSENSFAISENSEPKFSNRYDQISGADITIRFSDEKISGIDVSGNARSIYFLYDQGFGNGFNRVEGNDLFIYFGADETVSRIKVIEDPKGEYIPEQKISGASSTLPGFDFRADKPVKRYPATGGE